MSDTKWSKLLKAIAESDIKYISNEVRAKELACDSLWSILLVDYLGDGKFTADGIAGSIRTKHIEYIIIPFESSNGLYQMKELIDRVGRFEYVIDDKELTIKLFGYR
ncbi:hypothetical protein [Bacteroides fragilis]|uniref:hypothetical protein n=1 Tax=Bacteroides fragilis TaxID=817 RepID=UPI001CA8DBFC|nr:hypothetical protein [Bacteroides fragilis]MCM0325512.1 hypothetical protein [Bacteroides fragilis]